MSAEYSNYILLPFFIKPVCDKQPAILDTMYRQHVGNNRWIDLPCAPGTAYNPVDCACSLHIMTVPGKRRQQGRVS